MTIKRNIWIFTYGSLMWNPAFEYIRSCRAEIRGFRRAFCVSSIHHRGTRKKPGLVLGLDTGGACIGIAYEVGASSTQKTIKYLRAREQVTRVYREITRPIKLLDGTGRQVRSLVFAVDRQHRQYSGRLPFAKQFQMIAEGVGKSGTNIDYVISTARHLEECGITDRDMERLAHGMKRRKCTSRI